MRHARVPGGPPSSGSSSLSGGRLPPGTFREEVAGKHTRTKAIVILGIALPVLACIIGIAAWAVTTDVLRISPRAHDNAFNTFGHQGKTRIENRHQLNTQDVDIFQLHGMSQVPPTNTTPVSKDGSSTKLSLTPTKPSLQKTGPGPKPADILSKLISDMPDPKNPKNFVVFAPVADTPSNKNNPTDGRRFDGKLVIQDGDDLVAEESVYSIENSQEAVERKSPVHRRRKLSRDRATKYEDEPSEFGKDMKFKNGNPHYFPKTKTKGENLRSGKKLRVKPDDMLPEQPNDTPDMISNRDSGSYHSRTNPNGPQKHLNSRGHIRQFENPMELTQPREESEVHAFKQSRHFPQNTRLIPSPASPHQLPNTVNNGHIPNKNIFSNPPPHQPTSYGQQPNQKTADSYSQPQQKSPNQAQSLSQNPHHIQQPHHQPPPLPIHNQQNLGPNKPYPGTSKQSPQPLLVQTSSPFQNQPPNYQQGKPYNLPPQTYHSNNGQPPPTFKNNNGQPPPTFNNNNGQPPPTFNNNNGQPPSTFNNNNGQQSPTFSNNNGQQSPTFSNNNGQQPPTFSNNNGQQPPTFNSNNGQPQYFAPPPQTFHTKVSYDAPKSLGSYERVAQTTVEQHSNDGLHHHHHHHHHHEPAASDPVGDSVNLSDADRLGTIGLGLGGGPPRGITVQIGGGNGGGLTGMLPLGALGIAKGIVSSLLPRPAFGLNSKVFLGVEVGRGSGLSVLG